MRFLATTVGSLGNFLPLTRLCWTLHQRGHEIIILSQEPARNFFIQAGAQFGTAITREELSTVSKLIPEMNSSKEKLQMVWDQMLGKVTRRLCDLVEQYYIPGETILLCSGFLPGARLANEKLGIPLISLFVTPWDNFVDGSLEEADEVLRSPLDSIRAECGLAPMEEPVLKWSYSREMVLALFPTWFAESKEHWPEYCVQLPFLLNETEEGQTLKPDCLAFLEHREPPLVFVYGTYNQKGTSFLQSVAEICDRVDRPGIVLGWNKARPADLPENVMVSSFMELNLLLPRASLFVHHGGIGTMAEGMRAGVPHIALPNSDQQRMLAQRISELGIGYSIDLSDFETDVIVPEIKRILASTEIRANCDALMASFTGMNTWCTAADKVLGLAESLGLGKAKSE